MGKKWGKRPYKCKCPIPDLFFSANLGHNFLTHHVLLTTILVMLYKPLQFNTYSELISNFMKEFFGCVQVRPRIQLQPLRHFSPPCETSFIRCHVLLLYAIVIFTETK